MTPGEWESLCDGCGKCCLHKLEDEDTGEVFYTDIACRYLDAHSGRCSDYGRRLQNVPACLDLTADNIARFHWLPTSCSYRLLSEGKPLPSWHPLITGSRLSVHQAGMSVRGRVVAELQVDEDDYEDHIVQWVET